MLPIHSKSLAAGSSIIDGGSVADGGRCDLTIMKPITVSKAALALKQVLEDSRKRKISTAPRESVDDLFKRHGIVRLNSEGNKGIKVVIGKKSPTK